eukprot:CAMPEP_0194046186 /NCGR_PEP_ID=MMETSP0009_2-20130614/20031_1 /TAXON_ID=210454 /ORGANISM="Grammatophora oceanica, Strain CCMP 410" /LENGTH=380 /DNA_ID=CAMNT_0038691381 /DNA_START=68 /DNA_END=1210 /DNA_ORIENTATION=-
MAEEKKSETHELGIAARLARPNILELHPYRCARDDYDKGVLLDANENALGPTSLPTNSLDPPENHLVLERYPDPYQLELKKLYAGYRGCGITPAHIFVGVGSDEAIDLLIRIFCSPGRDNILCTPPTYGMYKVCAKVNDVQILNCPLTPEFDVRIPEILETVNDQTKLLFLCSPGNPTAKAIPLDDVVAIAESSSYQGIVVVDEAYVDFSDKGSAVELITRYPNIVVLQTLSKAFGLAGIRCGFALGSPDVIQLLNNVKAPYNVNSMTSEVAMNALKNIGTLDKNVGTLLEQRKVVSDALKELDFVVQVFPSDSNFLLFRLKRFAKDIYKDMAEHGVVCRYRGTELHCSECLRVTVGTPEENESFLKLLQETWTKFDASG